MSYKIMIDAGHGGADPGAVFGGRQEKDDNLRLALAVGDILSRHGIDVVYTRTDDIYQSPIEKARLANASGADYFISFHRNSSPEPNQYSGVETLVYDQTGQKVTMAQNINSALEKVGFKNLGVKSRPGLVVLRRTRMPALLIETGFINTVQDNQLFDEKFDEIAQGIAGAILNTLNVNTGSGNPSDDVSTDTAPVYYRVQTGSFTERPNADRMLSGLQDKGYPAFLVFEDGHFKVQVGAFRNLANAVQMERTLRNAGYDTWIDSAPASY